MHDHGLKGLLDTTPSIVLCLADALIFPLLHDLLRIGAWFGHGMYDDQFEATRQQLSQRVFESSELLFGRLQLVAGVCRVGHRRRRTPRAAVV